MDIRSLGDTPYKIAMVLVDDFALLSFSSVVEPLRAANMIQKKKLYDMTFIACGKDYATASSGVLVKSECDVGSHDNFDMVLVIAGGDPTKFDYPPLLTWLKRLSRRGVVIGGISGGPLIVAAAGLMEGRRMTVHWEHATALREISPSLLVERDLYIIDRNRITCAGGIAPLDLMHNLLLEQRGPSFARQVSDWFLHTEVRPAGGPQRSGLVERYGTHNQPLITAIEAMENHIADPLELGHLAKLCELSSRQLNRLFREKMQQSTMAFYRDLRLGVAKNLLAQSALSITEIALATGFANSAHFSQSFKAKFEQSPSAFRE